MEVIKYLITDEVGIHARPAGLLVREASKFKADITIEANGKSVSAKKLMAVMSLGAKQGAEVTLTIEGDDEAVAAKKLEKFLQENL